MRCLVFSLVAWCLLVSSVSAAQLTYELGPITLRSESVPHIEEHVVTGTMLRKLRIAIAAPPRMSSSMSGVSDEACRAIRDLSMIMLSRIMTAETGCAGAWQSTRVSTSAKRLNMPRSVGGLLPRQVGALTFSERFGVLSVAARAAASESIRLRAVQMIMLGVSVGLSMAVRTKGAIL
jgi:hypothetical protein